MVALVACWPGSAVASQPELRGRGAWLRRWGAVAALGGTAGSVLLLVTPPGVFGRVVPFLVVAGSLALLLQPWLAAWQSCGRTPAGGGCCCRAASSALSSTTGTSARDQAC